MKQTMNKILRSVAIGVALVGMWGGSNAIAADIQCFDTNKNYMEVPDSQVSACLAGGLGNIGNGINDDFLLGLAGSGYSEISDTSSPNPYSLVYTTDGSPTGGANSSGTWSFDTSAWSSYDSLAIGFKFGTGNTPDNWFVYSLNASVIDGTWEFFRNPAGAAAGISHMILYGADPKEVPVPATLALLGLGALGLGFSRRRKQA